MDTVMYFSEYNYAYVPATKKRVNSVPAETRTLSQYEAEKNTPKHICAHLLLQREEKDEATSDSEKFSC